jgi:hypothetical protein
MSTTTAEVHEEHTSQEGAGEARPPEAPPQTEGRSSPLLHRDGAHRPLLHHPLLLDGRFLATATE